MQIPTSTLFAAVTGEAPTTPATGEVITLDAAASFAEILAGSAARLIAGGTPAPAPGETLQAAPLPPTEPVVVSLSAEDLPELLDAHGLALPTPPEGQELTVEGNELPPATTLPAAEPLPPPPAVVVPAAAAVVDPEAGDGVELALPVAQASPLVRERAPTAPSAPSLTQISRGEALPTPQAPAVPVQPAPSAAPTPGASELDAFVPPQEPNAVPDAPKAPTTAATSPSSAVPQTTTIPLPPRVDAPEWQASFQDRVMWMVKSDVQVAQLRLNPPDLGYIEVRIAVNNKEADIAFMTQHGAVQDVLESAVPRLREMFAGSGVTLANVDVSRHQSGERSAQGQPSSQASTPGSEATDDIEPRSGSAHQGLIDHYA